MTFKQKKSYTKKQHLVSEKYSPIERDILTTVLSEDQKYTNDQVQKALQDFLKKEVK